MDGDDVVVLGLRAVGDPLDPGAVRQGSFAEEEPGGQFEVVAGRAHGDGDLRGEVNKYQRFVTFTHLPKSAVIRIFNLSGVLVRTMRKDDRTQFFQWDLRNENGFPVPAGMYIAHIDMPTLGKTKTLKLGVIPEQQFLDKW